jgi:hypothetical protein
MCSCATVELLEQDALYQALAAQPADNPDQISFDTAIDAMTRWPTVDLRRA